MSDPTLFDAPVTRGTHRRNDPQTSAAAARAKNPSADQSRCLAALLRNDGHGTIDTVCAYFALLEVDRDRGCLSRRLSDLEAAGRIRNTERTVIGTRGRPVSIWEVVDR